MLADQHQAYWQAINHPTGHRHGRVMGDVEGRGVADHLQRPLHVECPWRVRWGQRGRRHGQRGYEQQVIGGEHRVVGLHQPAGHIECFAVVVAAVIFLDVDAERRNHLRRLGEFIGAGAPPVQLVDQARHIQIRA